MLKDSSHIKSWKRIMDSVLNVLLLLLVLTVASVRPCILNPSCCKCGSMTPRDPYILLNEELVLNCTVNASFHHDSSSLYFTHKPNMSIPERELSKEYITTVNNTTISLRKMVRSLDEAGTYSCKIRDVRPGVVDRQVVEVEYPLRNVTDFHCMIYDWDVNKSCTWNLGPYVNLENINVTLFGKYCFGPRTCSLIPYVECPSPSPNRQGCRWDFGNNGGWNICPNMINPQKCVWKQEDNIVISSGVNWGYAYLIRNIKLNKTLQMHLNLNISDQTTIVKPAPVKYINVNITTDKGCVNLTWEYTRPNRLQAVEIKYLLYGRENPDFQTLVLKNSAVNTTICNLAPFSEYMFEIRVKPQKDSGNITGYWSSPARKLFKTVGGNPSAAPVLSLGSYVSNHEQCINDLDYRRVTVLWKGIPNVESNGNDVYYEVHIRKIGDTQTEMIQVKEMINKVDLDLKCRNGYIINVYAINEYGPSSMFGSITVPPNGTVEVPLNVQTETDNRVVNVSWDYNPQKNVSFTVYWCSKRGLRKEASWMRAGFGKHFLVFNASDFEEISDLKFGVSADSYADNISSGFEWNTCVYKTTEEETSSLAKGLRSSCRGAEWILNPWLAKMLEKGSVEILSYEENKVLIVIMLQDNLFAPAAPRKVSILSNKDGLVINWIPPTCDEMSSKPVKYQLSWCPTDGKSNHCQGPEKTCYIQGDDSVDYEYSLSEGEVEMSQWYGIVIKSISSLNKTSAPTEMFHGQPVRNYLLVEEIIGISLASVVVLFIIAAGVMWSIQCCYRLVKSYVKPDPIHLPTVQTNNVTESGVMSAYKESSSGTRSHSPIQIPAPSTSPLIRQNGVPFQFQYSMDSGRGSLPVEDVLDHETHPPIPESMTLELNNPVPFVHLPSPRPESILYSDADNSCIGISSSSLTNYRAICQATESDSSSDETSSVISETQEEDLRPYIKAGSHSSSDNVRSLPDYINDVKSGPSTPKEERHAKLCLKNTLLTHSCIDITKYNLCEQPGKGTENSHCKRGTNPSASVPRAHVLSSSKHTNPVYDDSMVTLSALEMCKILISVDSSLSMERRLTDELDTVSVNSVTSNDVGGIPTPGLGDSEGDLSSSVNMMASSDYLPIDSMQFTSSCFSIYDSSSLMS